MSIAFENLDGDGAIYWGLVLGVIGKLQSGLLYVAALDRLLPELNLGDSC